MRDRQRQGSVIEKVNTSSPFAGEKKSTPSVNRMLQDLKKLDYYKNPNAILKNVNETLAQVQI